MASSTAATHTHKQKYAASKSQESKPIAVHNHENLWVRQNKREHNGEAESNDVPRQHTKSFIRVEQRFKKLWIRN